MKESGRRVCEEACAARTVSSMNWTIFSENLKERGEKERRRSDGTREKRAGKSMIE